MEAVYEVLSTILFFLALVFPAFLFYTLRKQAKERRNRRTSDSRTTGGTGKKAADDTGARPDARSDRNTGSRRRYPDAIRRVMETQGIRRLPFDRNRSEPAYRNQYSTPAERASASGASKQSAAAGQKTSSAAARNQPAARRSIKPLRSDITSAEQQKKQTLESLNRYPVKKRAIVLSEIIGKPKGLQDCRSDY